MLIIPPASDHCVYLLTRRDHVVIYVGVTSNFFARLGYHSSRAWWDEVAMIQVESFVTRGEADRRETDLIRLIAPIYNVCENPDGVVRHLEEMRIATAVIMGSRNREVIAAPLVGEVVITPVSCVPTPPDPEGVTLREALPHLAALPGRDPLSMEGLRTASKRAGFPQPQGAIARSEKVYDLEELIKWRQSTGQNVRLS